VLDTTQWTTGKQFSVVEVEPPPEGLTSVRYQVTLVPRDEYEPAICLRCETTTPGAAPLQVQDVVAVKGRTLSSVLVERLVQGVLDGFQYLLAMPSQGRRARVNLATFHQRSSKSVDDDAFPL
jgi:hypothetical protein